MLINTTAKILSAVAAVLLGVLAAVSYQSKLITANIVDGDLVGLTIQPRDAVIATGESIRLTAEGNYGTITMPVRADWFTGAGGELGELEHCMGDKTCTFTAGDVSGVAVIQAQIGDGEFIDTTEVLIEEGLRNPFLDELPDWAFEAVVRLHREGIIKGYDDGRYGPGDSVTRGQVVTLIYRILVALNLVDPPQGCVQVYNDVTVDHYAFESVCAFSRQEWASPGGNFEPDIPAPRGETAAFVERVFGVTLADYLIVNSTPPRPQQIFDDIPADHRFYDATWLTNAYGIMTGYPSGDFGIDDALNRAAVATVMYRLKNLVEDYGIASLADYRTSTPTHPAPGPGPEPSVTPATTCVVLEENGDWPAPLDPPVGDGYAKKDFIENYDVMTLRERCPREVFEDLMDQYCKHGNNRAKSASWSVHGYDSYNGGPGFETALYHTCPEEGSYRDLFSHKTGACAVIAPNTNKGGITREASEAGEIYVKRNVEEERDIWGYREACTDELLTELTQEFCDRGLADYANWSVLMYDEYGGLVSIGSANFPEGTNRMDCSELEQESK